MDPTAQLITMAISAITVFGAFAAWIVRHMDRRFAEARADTRRQFDEMQRQFAEAKADTHQRFAEMQQRFTEAKADTQRQFDELKADVQRGFEQGREDYLRLEKKMEDRFEAHGEQIANLRQDVGRLQGIVERTSQPRRFAVQPVQQELGVRDEVRETRMSYDAGHGDEDSEPGSGAAGHEDE